MPLLLFVSPVVYLIAADADRIDVDSDPAVVSVVHQQDGRRLLRLPELKFPMRINARCGRGGKLQSVSISVADTRQTIAAEDYPATDVLATTVSVSPRQVSPVAVEGFCTQGEPVGTSRLLETALTAQISLQCALEDSRSVIFVAEPLDVKLVCGDVEPAESE